jgi:circadian clock protein KaiC
MISDLKKAAIPAKLTKALTGIKGFDEVTEGGLPKNRPTLLCGNTGCGKTVMSMEFLVHGADKFNEPGVFFSFEETVDELITNMKSIHIDIEGLINKKKIYIEYLESGKSQVAQAGSYDLEGLFMRLQNAIQKVGAKRVVLDSLDALFYGLDREILRIEVKRLFKWLKENGVTSLITSEIDEHFITKSGLEQFVADCVITLDSRVINQTTTRRMRIVKMRGSGHGINEYPFMIDGAGVSILPITSQLGSQNLTDNRILSGIKDFDGMLDGKGYFEGSSILVSGSAGTGKTSIAISLISETCKNKMKSLYCAFEESTSQLTRNMRSIGLDIQPYITSGLLKIYSSRPTIQNLELHLISIQKIIEEFNPRIIVLDPITNLMSEGINSEIRQMLAHFVDFLKSKNITTLFTAAITLESIKASPSDEGISAMMDTWILVRDIELNSERNRGIYVLKSRGMNHSTQVREFVITDEGIALLPIYISPHGVLTGTSKLEETLREEQERKLFDKKIKIREQEIEIKREIMENNILLLKTEFNAEVEILSQVKIERNLKNESLETGQKEIADLRNNIKSSEEKSKNRNK